MLVHYRPYNGSCPGAGLAQGLLIHTCQLDYLLWLPLTALQGEKTRRQKEAIDILGGSQNYGPLLSPLNTRCRIILRAQTETIVLTTTHVLGANLCFEAEHLGARGRAPGRSQRGASAGDMATLNRFWVGAYSPLRGYHRLLRYPPSIPCSIPK